MLGKRALSRPFHKNESRRQFGPQVHREVIGDLLQSSFAEAVSEKQLSPAGNPRIEPQSIDLKLVDPHQGIVDE